MADNVTPKYVEKQTAKNTLADTDLLPVKDMTAKKMVKATLLAVANYIVTKLKVLTFDNLKTTNKTLPGAVNEHIEDKKNPHGTTIEQLSGVPNTRKVNGKALSSDINLTSSDVGADASGTASSAVSSHNTNVGAHNDIRLLIQELTERMTVYHDTDDTTLDQASEFLAYIKANRSLIESITTSKVSVDDIINDLATNVANKPLSAAQGVVIKKLIDALQSSVDELEDKDISSLEEQTSAADTDVFALETSGTVKKITFLNICNAIVAKLSSLTVSALDTTAKTLVGAINELNSTTQNLESTKISIDDSGIHFVKDLILPISNYAGGLPVTKIYMNWNSAHGWCLMVKFFYNNEIYTGCIKLTESSKDS